MGIYAFVVGAPEAYSSRRVCLSICIFKSRFFTMLEI